MKKFNSIFGFVVALLATMIMVSSCSNNKIKVWELELRQSKSSVLQQMATTNFVCNDDRDLEISKKDHGKISYCGIDWDYVRCTFCSPKELLYYVDFYRSTGFTAMDSIIISNHLESAGYRRKKFEDGGGYTDLGIKRTSRLIDKGSITIDDYLETSHCRVDEIFGVSCGNIAWKKPHCSAIIYYFNASDPVDKKELMIIPKLRFEYKNL